VISCVQRYEAVLLRVYASAEIMHYMALTLQCAHACVLTIHMLMNTHVVCVKQVSSMLKRLDADCDGRISLSDLMSFMNKASLTSKSNTDSPLEAKLRRVLAKAEQLGTPIEEAFKHFDKVQQSTTIVMIRSYLLLMCTIYHVQQSQ
jgi:hypothetical protein